MRNKLFIAFVLYSSFSCQEKKPLKIISLNPAFEERYSNNDTIYPELKTELTGVINRFDYFGIDGFYGKNVQFDRKLKKIVDSLGNINKSKFGLYGIYFYELGDKVNLNEKYKPQELRKYIGKSSCLSHVVFRKGRLVYFVYIENEKILFNYLTNEKMDEIYE
jgi:hypothetical protein